MHRKIKLFLLIVIIIIPIFFSVLSVKAFSQEILSNKDIDITNLDVKSIIDESFDNILYSPDQSLDKTFAGILSSNSKAKGAYQWIFMVYMDGDNNLESAAINDFLEMAQIGSTGDVAIIVQLDRIDGYSSYPSVGEDWEGCARFLVEQGDTPVLNNAEMWPDESYQKEVDMGDPQTLVDFVVWVRENHSASNYALILWNHGNGWRERIEKLKKELQTKDVALSLEEKENIANEIKILEQKTQKEEGAAWKAVCWDDTTPGGGVLYTKELMEALDTLYDMEIGIDLIGFDACLIGMLEVAHEIRNYGTIMVASEASVPNDGWPYDDILEALVGNSGMSVEGFGSTIVEKYGEFYNDYTLSAVQLPNWAVVERGIDNLSATVNTFAETVMNEDDDWDVIFSAQQQAGYYTYTYYRDLGGFIEYVIANATNENIATAAQFVKDTLDECIVANYSSTADKGSGLSIYFPDWYWDDVDSDYNNSNLLFVAETSWDEFLSEFVNAHLVPSHTGRATYTKNITGGTTTSAYVMVSSPVRPSDLDPLANLQDDLGDYSSDMWRLFRWNPSLQNYKEYPFAGDDVVLGNGYWLISRESVNIDITGDLEETNAPSFIFLYPGWNQIGTPFNFHIDWDTVQVTDGWDIYNATSLENVLTYRTLWKYANSNYSASAVMEPGKGYWIKNLTKRNLYLIVNPVRSTLSRSVMVPLETVLTKIGKAEGTPPAPPGGIDPEQEGQADDNGGSGATGTECFIATACFGSPMAGEVEVLRNFRDKYLLSNPIGEIFVSTYYRYSPPIAKFIGNHKFLKVIVRSVLYPIVKGCNLTVEDK